MSKCLQCGKETSNPKFCTSSCAAKYNNHLYKKKPEHHCLFCGKVLNDRRNKFCNNTCHQDMMYQEFIRRWKSGVENGIKGDYQVSGYIRRYLFEKYDGKCARCGWHAINPYTKKIPLEVEHIDGNYMNNDEDNLTLLCPNCHS